MKSNPLPRRPAAPIAPLPNHACSLTFRAQHPAADGLLVVDTRPTHGYPSSRERWSLPAVRAEKIPGKTPIDVRYVTISGGALNGGPGYPYDLRLDARNLEGPRDLRITARPRASSLRWQI